MSLEDIYNNTTVDGAVRIFLSGKIMPSQSANGDAFHGSGVYLTTVDPSLGRMTVVNNNWAGSAQVSGDKLERYFEIRMPSDEVKRARDKRDIQVSIKHVAMKMFIILSHSGVHW